jgi:immune inhibitor A
MRRLFAVTLGVTFISLLVASGALASGGRQFADPFVAPTVAPSGDSLSSPMQQKQQVLRQKAMAMEANGTIAPGTKVGRVAKGQYVQLQQTGHSNIFVILAQFGNQIDSRYGGTPGPSMGEIQPPDRSLDNSTIWFDDGYTPDHYKNLYFDHFPGDNSVSNFYQSESSGRFSFDGDVTNWVTVPFNEARYGADYCGSTVCSSTWQLLRDAANQWVLDQEANGMTLDQIKAYLARFDQEDRYDYNGNGNFNEPDGYIDHYQLIHAGEGEEIGGGAQGTDAIWSHRWYAWSGGNSGDGSGPANGGQFGGFEIGQDVGQPTGFWVGDYVTEPENAGTGVISHETGHDYGLPDEYDTSYAGEAPSTWWTIMSQGSYGNDNTNGIGNRPVDFDAWDKFQLGWLNYQIARPFTEGKTEVKLGPAETNTKQAQGVFVILPKKAVDTQVGAPTDGAKALFSGSGDSYDTTATKTVDVPASGATLSADTWFDIEEGWDYAYLEVSTDGGTTWTHVHTSLSTSDDPNGQNTGEGITGTSGHQGLGDAWYNHPYPPEWVPVTADLSAYAGQTVQLRFEYWTDVASHGAGFEVDNLKIGTSFADSFETEDGWTLAGGFHLTTGTDSTLYNQYYVVENRQYMNYDTGLRTSPYNFYDPSRPNWVEHYPFEDGVLVSYWDTSQGDNNTGQHYGDGLILPIDLHPNPIMMDNGQPARDRMQAYDATMSTTPTDGFYLHNGATGGTYLMPSQPGVTVFDDRNNYWNATIPAEGVKTPATGTIIRLKSIDQAGFANVSISAAGQ